MSPETSSRIRTGPNQRVKKILVAALDENDKPIFATTIVDGVLEVDPETDSYEDIRSMDGTILRSWDVVSGLSIRISGKPEAR